MRGLVHISWTLVNHNIIMLTFSIKPWPKTKINIIQITKIKMIRSMCHKAQNESNNEYKINYKTTAVQSCCPLTCRTLFARVCCPAMSCFSFLLSANNREMHECYFEFMHVLQKHTKWLYRWIQIFACLLFFFKWHKESDYRCQLDN